MSTNAIACAGDGFEGVSLAVRLTGVIKLVYVNEEADFGSLNVYMEAGCHCADLYTDSGLERGVMSTLRDMGLDTSDTGWSEYGLQGASYINLDVGPAFLATWDASEVAALAAKSAAFFAAIDADDADDNELTCGGEQ